jgi:hypothetical protein
LPSERETEERERASQREPLDPPPSQAEGDEKTVDEALRRQEASQRWFPRSRL